MPTADHIGPDYRDLATVERMFDAVVANEGEPDVVQLSGGEPTLHPELFAILDAARRRPIKHLMLNTNGIRIANEPGFAERLAEYGAGFEVYLQWDSLRPDALKALRGVDLSSVRQRALERLNQVGLSTTLVMTIGRGINDQEIGAVIEYAAHQRCVRGVTLQPVQHAGRTENYDAGSQRLTLTEVRQMILDQTTMFAPADIIPVPCNPDALAMAYAIKDGEAIRPLTHLLPPEVLLAGDRNTIVFERDPALKAQVFKLFATNQGRKARRANCASYCVACRRSNEGALKYDNVFRVLIMQFIDAWNFDVRAMKKSCVHIAQPDGRLIPFEAFNLFYRDGKSERLEALRREVLAPFCQNLCAGRCIRRDGIVMRQIIIVVVFLAGLLGLLMSLCGGGFFVVMAYGALSNIFRSGQQGQMIGDLVLLAIPATFAVFGAVLFWVCFKFIRRRDDRTREKNDER